MSTRIIPLRSGRLRTVTSHRTRPGGASPRHDIFGLTPAPTRTSAAGARVVAHHGAKLGEDTAKRFAAEADRLSQEANGLPTDACTSVGKTLG